MINGLEGIPGSGKSYEAVVYHVLHALSQGRRVITNLPLVLERFGAIDPTYPSLIELRTRPAPIRGKWDAEAAGAGQDAFKPFPAVYPGAGLETVPAPDDTRPFGHVWCYWSDWRHPTTGHGPLFVIDECHNALPKIGTDPEVVQWYKLHRHFNMDVLLMTQNFRDVCPSITGLIEMLIRCRKASVLGKPDSYIRRVMAGYRGAEISNEIRPYKPQFFPLYKSHTQGNSVAESLASDVAPFAVRFRRYTRWVWASAVIGGLAVAWKLAWDDGGESLPGNRPMAQKVHKIAPSSPATSTLPTVPGVNAAAPKTVPYPLPPDPPEVPEPYESHSLHLVGQLWSARKSVHAFVIAQNGQVVARVTSNELVEMGYKWLPTTPCTGTLRWYDTQRAVVCGLPQVSM